MSGNVRAEKVMKIRSFEELEIWKLSTEISIQVYGIISKGRFLKDFGITDQLRRASVSISSNIAEGFERNNNNEFIYFLKVSKGSCGELRTQLYICSRIAYITHEEYYKLNEDLIKLSSMIGRFISYLGKTKESGEFKSRNSKTR